MDVVLLESEGSDESRIVIRRVRATDRLTARLRSSALDRRPRGGPVPRLQHRSGPSRPRVAEPTRAQADRPLATSIPRYVAPASAGISQTDEGREQLATTVSAVEWWAELIEGEAPVDVRGIALARVLLATDGRTPYRSPPTDAVLSAVGEAVARIDARIGFSAAARVGGSRTLVRRYSRLPLCGRRGSGPLSRPRAVSATRPGREPSERVLT